MNLYVVTGTSRGLGEALARLIARDPANELIAIARRPGSGIARAVHIAADLADARAVEQACVQLAARVKGRQYEKAVLVNNAGVVQPVAPLERTDAGELERNLVVNLVAPMILMRGFLNATAEGARLRRIINISSGAGRRPVSGWSAYCAAKAGLDMATRVVALEAESRGLAIEAVSLAPGVIDTGMQEGVRTVDARDFADVERFRKMKEDGTLRPADDVAADILRAEAGGRLAASPVADLRELAAGAE